MKNCSDQTYSKIDASQITQFNFYTAKQTSFSMNVRVLETLFEVYFFFELGEHVHHPHRQQNAKKRKWNAFGNNIVVEIVYAYKLPWNSNDCWLFD